MTCFPSDIRLSPAAPAQPVVGRRAHAHGTAVETRMTANPRALAWRAAP